MSAELSLLAPGRLSTLEEKLVALCAFGAPTLHRMKSGWWCTIEMHVAAAGTSFKIQSESDAKSPLAAVDQCEARIVSTLSNLTLK